jgi:hypothetical protein
VAIWRAIGSEVVGVNGDAASFGKARRRGLVVGWESRDNNGEGFNERSYP